MLKQKDPVEFEFDEKEFLTALQEGVALAKEESRVRKLEKESRSKTLLTPRKTLASNRLRAAAL